MNGEKKMKFFYNNKLVRTSKTKRYKYAVIRESGDDIKVFACSETRANAQKALERTKNEHARIAKSNLDFGKKPEKLEWLKQTYGEEYDAETEYKKFIETINNYKIVELEER